MIKNTIRFASFLLALFIFITFFQFTIAKQQKLPFHTNEQFDLNLGESKLEKHKIIEQLNEMTIRHKAILVKVTTDPNDYKNNKDIVWFGDKQPDNDNVIIIKNNIKWLDSNLKGHLISSDQIHAIPLYGVYAMKRDNSFKIEVSNWAESNGISITWIKSISTKAFLTSYLYNGMGNAVITAFLLFISIIITWFVKNAKNRSIRLQGGVPLNRIHKEDSITILKLSLSGFIVSFLVSLTYIVLSNDSRQISLIIIDSIRIPVLLCIITYLLTLLFSFIVRPKTTDIASRKIPLHKFRMLGIGIRVISILLAILIIPTTVFFAIIAQGFSQDYSIWNDIHNDVTISIGEFEPLMTSVMLPEVHDFFKQMDNKHNISLSYILDRGIGLNKDELNEYDHIIIVDQSWLATFDVGVQTQKKNGMLRKIDFHSLSKPLQDLLNGQMPLLTSTKEIHPKGLDYYTFKGNKFLALSPNDEIGGKLMQTKNPLVILVDSVDVLNIKGFLLPALSSGNLIFKNQELLTSYIHDSPINEYISSIDSIASTALGQAQMFHQEAVYYFMACIFIFIAMIVANIMNAQLWVNTNKKRIFILHTFGQPYHKIIRSSIYKDMTSILIAIFLGTVLSYLSGHTTVFILIPIVIFITVVNTLSNIFAYQRCVRSAFHRISRREE